MRLCALALFVVTLALPVAVTAEGAKPARAREQKEKEKGKQKEKEKPPHMAWCAAELETLPGDVCFAPVAHQPDATRTLVIFLHGLVKAGAGWQHSQMRLAARGGKRLGFSVLAPRGKKGISRYGADMVSWPTSRAARAAHEAALLSTWVSSQKLIEKRQGAPFDEVFVVGFSNGAYYAGSLALRGRLSVDGYAVFAGGSPYRPSAAVDKRAPIFVGISSKDDTTLWRTCANSAPSEQSAPQRRSDWPAGFAAVAQRMSEAGSFLSPARAAAVRLVPDDFGDDVLW